jgi:hypothetical protein
LTPQTNKTAVLPTGEEADLCIYLARKGGMVLGDILTSPDGLVPVVTF